MPALSYHNRFHDALRGGRKRQTIRGESRRSIKAGDRLYHRGWSGRPYRSAQIDLGETVCASTSKIWVDVTERPIQMHIVIDDSPLMEDEIDELAEADGFESAADMGRYYLEREKAGKLELPFTGVLIRW